MNKIHDGTKPGCMCRNCLKIWDRCDRAARSLYFLLDLEYHGLTVAGVHAEFIRAGKPEFLPDRCQWRYRLFRQHASEWLDSLVAEILGEDLESLGKPAGESVG